MGEALAEAQLGARARRAAQRRRRRGRRGDGRPRPRPGPRDRTTPPPTPSSSPSARRLASSAPTGSATATIFATVEPCAMCVGALLESDVEALVFAVPNPIDGAAGSVLQLAQHAGAAAPPPGRQRDPPGRGRGAPPAPRSPPRPDAAAADRAARPAVGRRRARRAPSGILSRGEVSEWLMVPLSKSGVRKHRGFESHPLRQSSAAASRAPPRDLGTWPRSACGGADATGSSTRCARAVRPRRGRLVA